MNIDQKACSKCGVVKNLEDFVKNKRCKNGISGCCIECRIEQRKQYRKANAEKIKAYNKAYNKANLEEIRACQKAYYKANAERVKAYRKAYREANPEKVRACLKACRSKPHRKIRDNMALRMRNAIKSGSKSASTTELLGASGKFVKKHIEAQWTEGMSWETYGPQGWHIDHEKPCASFDLTDPEEQRKCFHYSNLKPLWWPDNIKKSDKYDGEDIMAWGY